MTALAQTPSRDVDAQTLAREVDALSREAATRTHWYARRRAVDRGANREPFYFLEFRTEPSARGDLEETLLPTRVPWLTYVHQTQSNPRRDGSYWHPVSADELRGWLAEFRAMYLRNDFVPPGFKGDVPNAAMRHPSFLGRVFAYQLASPMRTIVGFGPASAVAFGALRARVVDDRGMPIAGAQVVLAARGREISRVSDADGRVWFAKLEPGAFTVRVHGRRARADVSVEAFGVVRGRVAASAPSGPDRVELVAPDDTAFVAPVADATFETTLPAFQYRVRVPGFRFRASVTSAGQTRRLSGVARDEAGPMAGAAIEVVLAGRVVATTMTASDGAFRFDDLPAGALELRVPGHELNGAGVAAGVVHGTVAGFDASVPVELLRDNVVVARVFTDAQGAYRFDGVEPGSYAVRVADASVERDLEGVA